MKLEDLEAGQRLAKKLHTLRAIAMNLGDDQHNRWIVVSSRQSDRIATWDQDPEFVRSVLAPILLTHVQGKIHCTEEALSALGVVVDAPRMPTLRAGPAEQLAPRDADQSQFSDD